MTSGDLDEGSVAAPTARGPRVLVSASALAENIRIALAATPAGRAAVADLRADAWGHGAAMVAAELLAAGATGLRVEDGAAHALRAAGVPAVTVDAEPNIDPLTVYGLPGGTPGSAPVLRLSGFVLSVKELRAGEGVSYGYHHRASADTNIALVTGGYAQGIVRALGGRAFVAVAGAPHPIVGRIAMDVCVVDIGDAHVQRGAEVVFFGDPERGEPSIADWERITGMRAGELVAIVGQRAAREYAA